MMSFLKILLPWGKEGRLHGRKNGHCMQRHDLQEWDTTPHVHLDLENWLLTLIKI